MRLPAGDHKTARQIPGRSVSESSRLPTVRYLYLPYGYLHLAITPAHRDLRPFPHSLVLKAVLNPENPHLIAEALRQSRVPASVAFDPLRPYSGEHLNLASLWTSHSSYYFYLGEGPLLHSIHPSIPIHGSGVADILAVNIGVEMLNAVPGRVSTEVDAHLSIDTQATIHKALKVSQ